MTNSYLYDHVLSPFYDWLAPLIWPDWVHPNWITILGGLGAGLSAYLAEHNHFGWACLFFTLYHMCDNMDGKHARRTQQTSKLGGILDHMIDGTLGNIAGFDTICRFTFGRRSDPNDLYYWQGIHAYYCLWLAPHVVAHFSGSLQLGTKLFSIDECLLLTTVLLFMGWIYGDEFVILPDDPVLSERMVLLLQVLSILHGTLSSAYHYGSKQQPQRTRQSPPTKWNHMAGMLFVQYWLSGVLYPPSSFVQLYCRWIPVMAFVVITEEE